MYPLPFPAHNIMRWIVVLLAVYALVRIFMGVFGKRELTETDRKSLSYSMPSAWTSNCCLGCCSTSSSARSRSKPFGNFGAAMSNSAIRFFAVEHILLMVVAVVLAHVAVIMARRATTSASKFNRAAIWLTLSVLAVLVAIPWQRPLLPQLGACCSSSSSAAA